MRRARKHASIAGSLVAALAFAGATTGCSGGPIAPPNGGQGVYVLLSVGDSTLPYVLYTTPTTTARELADTLVLDGHGHAAQTMIDEIDSTGSSTPRMERNTSSMTYEVRSDSLYFDFTCPPNAMLLCVQPPVGWFLPDGRLQLGYLYMENGKRVVANLSTYRRAVSTLASRSYSAR